jgi:hypothetical protein
MRNDNYVVEIIPDFDELYFRLRAIDFDQHCYEGDVKIYMPQYFKENNPIINLGLKSMSPVVELQYQKEERARLLTRVKAANRQLETLLDTMRTEDLAPKDNVTKLSVGLAELYHNKSFLEARSMGDLIFTSLKMLEVYPVRKRNLVKDHPFKL